MMADVFLYVCSYVCACVVLFDILFAVYVYRSEHLLPKRVKEMRALLLSDMMNVREARVPRARIRAELEKRLMHETGIKAFMACNKVFLFEDPNNWKRCLRDNLSVFASLARRYARQEPEYQTLFARMIAELPLYACTAKDRAATREPFAAMARVFERQMADESAFLRQNAFKALVSLGDAEAVVSAFVFINRSPALINGKFLSDDLLAFPGDVGYLMQLLWACFSEFSPLLQTCIIDYFRFLPSDERQEPYMAGILTVLSDAGANSETRFAAIRYFRKHSYPPALPALMELLCASGKSYENFAAIAAMALQTYPGEQTESLLLKHLGDPDWYVRFNAAESLIHLGVDYEKIILESNDRFAKQMLIYRAEVSRLRGRNRGTA